MSRFLGVIGPLLALGACRDPGGPSPTFCAEAGSALAQFTPPGARTGPVTYARSKSSGGAWAAREVEGDGSWDDVASVLLSRCAAGWGAGHQDERALGCMRRGRNERWMITATPISSAPIRVRVEFRVVPD
jgi:hypothetical protein